MAPKNNLKISLLCNEIKIRETRDSEKKMNSIPSRIIPTRSIIKEMVTSLSRSITK
jgi:hypothetical protein